MAESNDTVLGGLQGNIKYYVSIDEYNAVPKGRLRVTLDGMISIKDGELPPQELQLKLWYLYYGYGLAYPHSNDGHTYLGHHIVEGEYLIGQR